MFPQLPKSDHIKRRYLGQAAASFGNVYRSQLPRGVSRGRSKAEFVAKCGDSLREIEEWSVPGGRDIDGEPAWSGRVDGKSTRQSAYWLELLAAAGIVPAAKLEPLRKEADELTAIFVTIVKRSKQS